MTAGRCTGWRALVVAVVALASSLGAITYPSGALAQDLMERDPEKCALVNLAHFYLQCATLFAHYVDQIQGPVARTQSPQDKAFLQQVERLRNEFFVEVFELYKLAGRKLHSGAMYARMKIDKPKVLADIEEDNRARREGTGLSSSKTSVTYLCSANVLYAEIKDKTKVQKRLSEFRGEAIKLIQAGKPCIK